ncbi:MAG: response regulator transcription factor [Chloroflexi bacterium]|nr:response regulator transcription factor [Chloroflexota bacterium]
MPGDKPTILVIEDEARVQRLEKLVLEQAGYSVESVASGEVGLEALVEKSPALVLLDISLPGMDGFTVCQKVREFSLVPVILVTGKGSEADKVRGLEAGADDYVCKPFSQAELLARVKAVLRRASLGSGPAEPAFHSGDLEVDFVRNHVRLAGREVELSATEHKLLCYLARNAGRILTPEQILERVWGQEYGGEVHLLRVTMGRLRQKLGDDPREPKYIVTRPGIGYELGLRKGDGNA